MNVFILSLPLSTSGVKRFSPLLLRLSFATHSQSHNEQRRVLVVMVVEDKKKKKKKMKCLHNLFWRRRVSGKRTLCFHHTHHTHTLHQHQFHDVNAQFELDLLDSNLIRERKSLTYNELVNVETMCEVYMYDDQRVNFKD